MKKTKLLTLSATFLMVLGAVSCGETTSSTSSAKPDVKGEDITITYSGTASEKEFNEGLFADFIKERKAAGDKNNYTIQYSEIGPDKIDEITDWAQGPDLYEYASDKVQSLVSKGAISKVIGKYKDYIKDTMSPLAYSFTQFNGDTYGYPWSGDNTYYLQYDKSIFSADDVKTVDGILARCEEKGVKFAYELQNGFWGAAAMFTFGADYKMTFDKDAKVSKVECDFDTEKGLKAAKAVYKILKHDSWVNASATPTATNQLAAVIGGTWAINDFKNALGDNYACAPMPTVTVDGETKHLSAFLGGKLFGVNPQTIEGNEAKQIAVNELAKFLSNEKAQAARFKNYNVGPTNKVVANSTEVKKNENIALLAKHSEYAHAQTAVPAPFWNAPGVMYTGIIEGTITEENLQDGINTMAESIRTIE